ncbi:MAG TPA: HDOD domain-containing protein [Candidatus Kapabacteria bacterium]|nr:HDOD domain-containing protein [Candidatus Kapabacteria bacterium]
MKDYTDLINSINDFPTLPTIYNSLLVTLQNPRSTIQDIANVISNDQVVVLKILKVTNSSLYGFNKKIDTITDAIFLLGQNEIKNIVLALSVMKIFSQIKSISNFNVTDLWKHSIAVGVIAKSLGELSGTMNTENLFVSGIIHDFGKLFFLKVAREEYLEIINNAIENKISLSSSEKLHFGINHDIIGGLLAKKWQLPNNIIESINFHNSKKLSFTNNKQIACIQLANIIANMLNLGNPGYEIIDQPSFDIWSILNLPPGSLVNMHSSILEQYYQSVQILSLSK